MFTISTSDANGCLRGIWRRGDGTWCQSVSPAVLDKLSLSCCLTDVSVLYLIAEKTSQAFRGIGAFVICDGLIATPCIEREEMEALRDAPKARARRRPAWRAKRHRAGAQMSFLMMLRFLRGE